MQCVPHIFPIEADATPVAPGRTFEHTLPDVYGRPWARIWERYREEGMSQPAADDLFDFD